MPYRSSIAAALVVALCACASAHTRVPPAPTPSEIPALQATLRRDSADVAVRLRLGEAYRRAGQLEAALVLLEPMIQRDPAATVYLGLVYEDLQRYTDARRIYQQYLERGRSAELKQHVRDRLVMMQRAELQAAVRAALARERQLAGSASAAPVTTTVGVFPFLAVTEDPQLRPLGIALAELLTTDLAQTDRLKVLERTQVQFLLDEIQLGATNRVDPATAALSGRILGAGTLIQGRVEGVGGDISLQTAVLRVPGDTVGANPLRERDAIARIMDIEKRLALSVFERMGITLTVAERQRVTRVQTTNVQALVAFGFGLESQDAGRFSQAAELFGQAMQLDPGFELARTRNTEAVVMSRAAVVTTSLLGRLAVLETGPLAEWRRAENASASLELMIPNPAVRDPAAEALGSEAVGQTGGAQIIIRKPGGGTP